MKYDNKCYDCEHEWQSDEPDEICPQCGESDNIGTDISNEE